MASQSSDYPSAVMAGGAAAAVQSTPATSTSASSPAEAQLQQPPAPPPPPPPPGTAPLLPVQTAPQVAASAPVTASTSSTPIPPPELASSSSSFKFPHYYNFPPMFTIQPNLATRRAQMDKWTALVLAYCRHYRVFRLAWGEPARDRDQTASSGPVRIDRPAAAAADDDDDSTHGSITYYAPDLFHNRQIDRALSPAAIREVVEALRQEGRAEYTSSKKELPASGGAGGAGGAAGANSSWIYWKKPEEWAAVVEAFVDDTGQRGSVLTLYELIAGDGARGTELFGLDPVVLEKALGLLVKRGKAQVFGQAESLGVKFF